MLPIIQPELLPAYVYSRKHDTIDLILCPIPCISPPDLVPKLDLHRAPKENPITMLVITIDPPPPRMGMCSSVEVGMITCLLG